MKFVPPQEHEIPVSGPDGTVRRRLVPGQDLAEALGRLVRDLPQGARVVTGERRRTAWNERAGRFEHVCSDCGTAGLVLERRQGTLTFDSSLQQGTTFRVAIPYEEVN